jgi:alkylated DNA repair dioxygenase AlkB
VDLFNQTLFSNVLPCDGDVVYLGKVFSRESSDYFFSKLLSAIEWKNDEAIVFGKTIITKRKVAWYGDHPFAYTYSNKTKEALKWTPELLELKAIVEDKSSAKYNSCLLNLYHNGDEGVSWHSDDEKELTKYATIASLSFGAERKFVFKHKENGSVVNTFLEHGSLLLMKGSTQTHWLHSLPKSKKVLRPRISLTFRHMNE